MIAGNFWDTMLWLCAALVVSSTWLVLGAATASRATFAALHGACRFGLTVFLHIVEADLNICPNLQVHRHCTNFIAGSNAGACCKHESTHVLSMSCNCNGLAMHRTHRCLQSYRQQKGAMCEYLH